MSVPDEELEKAMTAQPILAEDGEDDAPRPELHIAPKDRRLVTQPFDFIVSSLETQIKEEQIILQDEYQRRQVWDARKSSRLIESLLLNVPIPVCYFAELPDSSYSVIDGQQRLTSIARYLANLFPLSGLRVRPELNRKRFAELDPADQRIIKNRTIRCIVIQADSHPDIRFDVFERLNQSSVKLNAQELRNSTFRGSLNNLIKELCKNEAFQRIRRVDDLDSRMRDAEMILRFFAFHYTATEYRGFYATFLDRYLENGMAMTANEIAEHQTLFVDTISKAEIVFGQNAFRQIDGNGVSNQVNRAIFDVVMLTFARIDSAILQQKRDALVGQLKRLCSDDKEFEDAIGKATRDRARINKRVALWVQALRQEGIECPDIVFGDAENARAGTN